MEKKSYWLQIHKALHSDAKSVKIGDRSYPILVATNGCRYVKGTDKDLGPITIMEQNPNKSSSYAVRARAGETLSWVMPVRGSWILLDEPIVKEVTV